MNSHLRVTAAVWNRLWKQLSRSFRNRGAAETGAIGILGSIGGTRPAYTIAEMLWPEPGDLKIASNQSLCFDASYLRRAHLKMRHSNLAGLVLFHTHPFADQQVAFSHYDNSEEPKLVANLIDLEPRTQLVSVVAGKQSLMGRVWRSRNQWEPMSSLVIVGESLQSKVLNGKPEAPVPRPEAIFDRGLALTGSGALARLSKMTVAVIGASGTGSLMCEFLARAGCGRILTMDHDVVKKENINRILYATIHDAEKHVPKVNVLKRGIDSLGLPVQVDAFQMNVLTTDACQMLREADLILGCVDRAMPRHLICKFAMQYLVPYIDVGTEIGGNEHGIMALNARASLVSPKRPCLRCMGVVTSRRLRFESLTSGERARQAQLGYSDDLTMTQPAVMDLNAHAAGYGMMLVRHLLQPFLLQPLPLAISENLATFTTLGLTNAKDANPECEICQRNQHEGWSDCGPVVGLDDDLVSALMEKDLSVTANGQER